MSGVLPALARASSARHVSRGDNFPATGAAALPRLPALHLQRAPGQSIGRKESLKWNLGSNAHCLRELIKLPEVGAFPNVRCGVASPTEICLVVPLVLLLW